ncbi:hypothetical protein PHLGIDRAFT_11067 [Phlebiopsis gigantea 11061_1 CR5-6]|uniref:DUF6818 domain-containing protein n=1 Tax=Phlebiopsis gigantea (strain 11061_1 CR5-6) TaxID=745531 RepID=A0A0C3S4P9_PHLG1|nr:hypothetical protein PHLGIDRAFT_11067 [Phlebiopsis gigantea 11061_1 CR5-6]
MSANNLNWSHPAPFTGAGHTGQGSERNEEREQRPDHSRAEESESDVAPSFTPSSVPTTNAFGFVSPFFQDQEPLGSVYPDSFSHAPPAYRTQAHPLSFTPSYQLRSLEASPYTPSHAPTLPQQSAAGSHSYVPPGPNAARTLDDAMPGTAPNFENIIPDLSDSDPELGDDQALLKYARTKESKAVDRRPLNSSHPASIASEPSRADKGKGVVRPPPAAPSRATATAPSKPTSKVKPRPVGSSRAASSKKRALSPVPSSQPTRRGRAPGAAGYTNTDLAEMCRLMRQHLPLGPNEVAAVVRDFNSWARAHGRPERGEKAFSSKFNGLVKTPKPTGGGQVPEFIEDAWEIDDLMNERANTRVLDDLAIDGRSGGGDEAIEISSDDNDDNVPQVKKIKTENVENASALLHSSLTTPSGTSRTPVVSSKAPVAVATKRSRPGVTSSLVDTISSAFDPRVQAARDDARLAQRQQTTVMDLLSSQLREANTRIAQLQDRLADETRRADMAETDPFSAPFTCQPLSAPFIRQPFSAPLARQSFSTFICISWHSPIPSSPYKPSDFESYYPPSPLLNAPAITAQAVSQPPGSLSPSRSASTVSQLPNQSSSSSLHTPSALTSTGRFPLLSASHEPASSSSATTSVAPTGLNALAAAAAAGSQLSATFMGAADSTVSQDVAYSFSGTVTPRRQRIAHFSLDISDANNTQQNVQ